MISKYRPIPFRGVSSSGDENENQDEIIEDILALYEEANTLKNEVEDMKKSAGTARHFTEKYIESMENRLINMELKLKAKDSQLATRSIYIPIKDIESQKSAPVDEQLYADNSHGVAHLPIVGENKVSKIHQRNYLSNNFTTPSSLSIKVEPGRQVGWITEENDILNAVDGKMSTQWYRRIYTPLEDVNSKLKQEITISIPETSIYNRKINMISVDPFPAKSMSVERVEYRTSGNWQLIPGWEVDKNGDPIVKTKSGNILLCFPSLDATEVKITLAQEDWYEESGQKVFHFGLKEIGIYECEFSKGVGRFETRVTLDDSESSHLITEIKPVFSNDSSLTDNSDEKSSIFNYEVYTIDEQGNEIYTRDRLPITVTSDKVLIRGSISPDKETQGTPLLKAIELTYEKM